MKMVWWWLGCFLLLFVATCIRLFAQQPQTQQPNTKIVVPSELEQNKLGKLKAQDETFQADIQNLDAQIQVISARKYILQQMESQKKSELLGYSEEVKKNNKWDKDVTYDMNNGEYGEFTQLVKTDVKIDQNKK